MKTDDFANRLPLIKDNFRTGGVYSAHQINKMSKSLNNLQAGYGISVERNTYGGYKVSLARSSYAFKVYDVTDSSPSSNYAVVRVYIGSWTRNGKKITLTTDSVSYNYLTLTFSSGDGSYVVYAKLDDSMIPTELTATYTTAAIFNNAFNYLDNQDRYLKIADVVVSNGKVKSIVQTVFQDEDDIATKLPFQAYDFTGGTASATIKIRVGNWYDGMGSNEVALTTDSSVQYKTLTIASTGDYWLYVEVNSSTSPTTLTAYASSSEPAIDNDLRRVVARINVGESSGYRRLNTITQDWTGDIFVGGSIIYDGNSVDEIAYANRYYKVDPTVPGVVDVDYKLAPAAGWGQEGCDETGFRLEAGRIWHNEIFIEYDGYGKATFVNSKFQKCLPL
jgi:hypothetical protein